MAALASHLVAAQQARKKALVIPREHGAWGILLVPLATGAVAGLRSSGRVSDVVFFVVVTLSLFRLRTPVESLFGTSAMRVQNEGERRFVLKAVIGCAAISTAALAMLLWNGRNFPLLIVGVVAGLAFVAQAQVKRMGRKGRMPAQIVGAIGLTSTAAGAYAVATGRLDAIALGLWLANWLFAGDQIHFVQVRIHGSRAVSLEEKLAAGGRFFLGQIALIGLVLGACRYGLLPKTIPLAFIPVLARGTLWLVPGRKPLNVHRLGFTELAHAVIFGVLTSLAFLV